MKTQRNLDGVYYRVKRDGEWQNICFSDMTETERQDVIYERMNDRPPEEQAKYYRRMAEIMADCLYDLGEKLRVVCE